MTSDRLIPPPRYFLVAILAAATVWLGASSRFALCSGRDSDAVRLWSVSQYIVQRIDPWRISHETLQLNFGSAIGDNREHIKKLRLYEVDPRLRTDGIVGILSEQGPPTATYPPPCMMLFALLVGWMPQAYVLPIWLAVNTVGMALLAWGLMRWIHRAMPAPATGSTDKSGLDARLLVIALIAIWPPTHEIIRTSQFGFFIAVFIVGALLNGPRHPWLAGLLFSLALFKPHIALPFMLWPLVRGQWRTLLVAAATQTVGLLAAAWWVRASPVDLIRHWLGISPYMFQGAYTIMEFLLATGLSTTLAAVVVPPAFLLLSAAWVWRYRRARMQDAIAFLSLVSVFWVYHERYDFIVLLLPIGICLADLALDQKRTSTVAALVGLLFLGLALSDYAYLVDQRVSHAVRWAGRLALYALIPCFAWRMRTSEKIIMNVVAKPAP